VATVTVAIFLAIACVGLLLFFIHHISQAISVNHIVARIASETELVIDDVMPLPRLQTRIERADETDLGAWNTPLLSTESGYVRFVDTQRLLDLAAASRVKVRVVRRVGQFVPEKTPLLMVYNRSASPRRGSASFGTLSTWGHPEPCSRILNSESCRSWISPSRRSPPP
jgi:uncharacterized membrane protein